MAANDHSSVRIGAIPESDAIDYAAVMRRSQAKVAAGILFERPTPRWRKILYRVGFSWEAIRSGLWWGSAIGVGFVLGQYLEQYVRVGVFHSISGY